MANKQLTQASVFDSQGISFKFFDINACEGVEKLPLALKIVLENVLRNAASEEIARKQAYRILEAGLQGKAGEEIDFSPARVLFQDFTGVPAFVDFAAMREACANLGGNPSAINPQIPCELVIDHSVIADDSGNSCALQNNSAKEYERNIERYSFLKWAQESFENVKIVPPGVGICHQLNIEHFARVVMLSKDGKELSAADAEKLEACDSSAGESACDGVLPESILPENAASGSTLSENALPESALPLAYFDTLVGTDSHTPTANGLGVLGWGVGGIEAEAAALGQAITTLVPRVVGIHLTGQLQSGVSGMDVSLRFAQMLRQVGVVGCFVECFGEGVAALSATQRACISNMTPEYGSTCTLFPIDEKTIEYLRMTGRSEFQLQLISAYAKHQGLWNNPEQEHVYSEVLELDLSTVEPSLAGPSRPHDRIPLRAMSSRFKEICKERKLDLAKTCNVEFAGKQYELTHGALAIAAVTSCTTATDPEMMLAAGLLAKKAAAAGLRAKPWVKTIFAPGSRATEALLKDAGLMEGMEALGFHTCGFGCMSCIGNSGPVFPAMHEIASEIELTSILSGNRNFDGRISADVSQNYLCAPALVIAYAIAGSMEADLNTQALGVSADGTPIMLVDIMPSKDEVLALVEKYVKAELYVDTERLFAGDDSWKALSAKPSSTYAWDEASTYVKNPPYFDGMTMETAPLAPIKGARVLGNFGDFITTDHISPAGSIASYSPAARYLREHGVAEADFNTYGSRRGNHDVMMRGTFANVKLQNKLAGGKVGGWTRDFTTGDITTGKIVAVYDAAQSYKDAGEQAVLLAGLMYGSGSSRDWAAKGPMLLGVRAVIAKSYERIHRSNLIDMGIIPLQFEEGQDADALGLDGSESISIDDIDFTGGLPSPAKVNVEAKKQDGTSVEFKAIVRVDTPTEGAYILHGGILQYVIRGLA
jgi:aconitate hydratase